MNEREAMAAVRLAGWGTILREQKLKQAEARMDKLAEALRDLYAWSPQTEQVRQRLHPQHGEALEKAGAALADYEEQG